MKRTIKSMPDTMFLNGIPIGKLLLVHILKELVDGYKLTAAVLLLKKITKQANNISILDGYDCIRIVQEMANEKNNSG